jgi:hypothetical protein
VIKSYPVVIGAGIPMFSTTAGPSNLTLSSSRTLRGGAVVSCYAQL